MSRPRANLRVLPRRRNGPDGQRVSELLRLQSTTCLSTGLLNERFAMQEVIHNEAPPSGIADKPLGRGLYPGGTSDPRAGRLRSWEFGLGIACLVLWLSLYAGGVLVRTAEA